MKTSNFPAKKKARQVAAKLNVTVAEVSNHPDVVSAREIRTKKYRGPDKSYIA